MKNIFVLLALGTSSLVLADYQASDYRNSCQGNADGKCYYQEQSYDNNQRNSNQGYYNDQGNWERNNQNRNQWNRDNQQNRQNDQWTNQDRMNGNNSTNNNQGMMNNQSQWERDNQGKSQWDTNRDNNQVQRQTMWNSQDQNSSMNKSSMNSMNNSSMNNSAMNNSDQEISRNIRDNLKPGWLSKGYETVNFDVNNGNVMLRGTVQSLDDKNKIEENIRKIDGVKSVDNKIVINTQKVAQNDRQSRSMNDDSTTYATTRDQKYPQDYAVNDMDRKLNEKIRDKVGSGWFSRGYDNITLKTENGMVTLSGTVDKLEDIQKVSDELKKVDGVKSVNNQLVVKTRSP